MPTDEQRKYWREFKAKQRAEKPDVLNERWRKWRAKKQVEDPQHIKARDKKAQQRSNGRRRDKLGDPTTAAEQLERERQKRKAYKAKYYQTHKEKWYEQYRKSRIRYEYGISHEEYEQLKERCGNLCEICRKPETHVVRYRGGERKSALSVDHCHTTGKVRGLLCARCNKGLGMFNDNLELLKETIRYLESHSP